MKVNIYEWNKSKWIYNDIHNLGFPFYHIHPFKQQYAKMILDRKPFWVNQMFVFGSAVHPWHFYEKDLDICFIGINPDDFLDKTSLTFKEINTDILVYSSLDDLYEYAHDFNSVRCDILQEGVLLHG